MNPDLVTWGGEQVETACPGVVPGLLALIPSLQVPLLVPGDASLDVVKDAEGFGGVQQAAPGETFTWHISVTNTTAGSLTGTLTDNLPTEFGNGTTSTFGSGTPTCNTGATAISCTITALPAGETAFVDITQTVPEDYCDDAADLPVVSNSASSMVTGEAGPSDTDSAAITIVCSPVLEVDKEVIGGEQESGDTFGWLITLENVSGPSGPTVDAYITDDLPDDLTFVPSLTISGFDTCAYDGDILRCDVSDLDPDETVFVLVRQTIPDDVCATFGIENLVEAFVAVTGEADPLADFDRELVHILCSDVGIDKETEFDSYSTGDLIRYGLTVFNEGPGVAQNVVVTDKLPEGLTFVSATVVQGSGSCSFGGGVVTCDLGDIPVTESEGDLYFIIIEAIITNEVPCDNGNLTNKAKVSADNEEEGQIFLRGLNSSDGTAVELGGGGDDNNKSEIETPVECAPNIVITKTAELSEDGRTVTYTITALNNGTEEATGVVVNDDLDDSLTDVQASTTGDGPCVIGSGNTVSCDIGAIPVDGSETVTITAGVPVGVCPARNQAEGAAENESREARHDNEDSVSVASDCVLGTTTGRGEVLALAFTGFGMAPLAMLGGVLLLGGATLRRVGRDRRRHRH